jgi:hypothetical protein
MMKRIWNRISEGSSPLGLGFSGVLYKSGAVLIILCFAFLFNSPEGWGQSISFTRDFETGDLRGWTRTGNAFNYQPTFGDNPTARRRGQPSKHQGRYWIGTYEKYQGLPGQRPGAVQGDQPQGTLTSLPFSIPSGTLSFLIGGGNSLQTRVELLISGRRVLHASGRNTETMHCITWNLVPHGGKTGQIRIVDESSGGWGHINVDDFRFVGATKPSVPISKNLTGRWRCNDGGTYFIRQAGSELWWYGQSGDGGATWSNVYHGRMQGNKIIGQWADVPHGKLQNAGEMSLEVLGSRRLKAIRRTGGFGGSEWSR